MCRLQDLGKGKQEEEERRGGSQWLGVRLEVSVLGSWQGDRLALDLGI